MARNVQLTMVTVHNKSEPLADRRRQVLELIDQAGQAGSDIVLLPECADHHRTHEAAAAHEKGKQAVREVLGLSLDSPWLGEIIAMARKYRMVVIPCIVHNDGEHTYNAALVFGPDGSLLGTYRKSHLAPGEEEVFEFGQSLEPVDTPFGRLGIFICWDIHFPEITRVYELKGAELLLWSTMRHGPFDRELADVILPSRCFTHGLPLGVATYAVDNQAVARMNMNSMILDSWGQVLAGGMQTRSGLLRATVDLDARPQINRRWNVPELLDYSRYLQGFRRPELYGALLEPPPKKI